MRTLEVAAQNGAYEIKIGPGVIEELPKYTEGRTAAVISDEIVWPLYGEKIAGMLAEAGSRVVCIRIPAGEESKSHEQLLRIYRELIGHNVTRSDRIVALGGGVVGDIAGFAAATYFRGTPFIQIPTTLLAQVDSAVGGKVAVNLPEAKNSVGAFYQPMAVLSDTDTLDTLDKRQVAAGMAEVIKYGAIADEVFFRALQEKKARIEEIVERCCAIKADYVAQDTFDTGKRMELNFGHTLGHALEQTLGYGKILHGEGVALGMVAMARLGEALKITPAGTAQEIKETLSAYGLPVEPEKGKIDRGRIVKAILSDKKFQNDRLNVILLSRIGEAVAYPVKADSIAAMLEKMI